MKTTNDSVSITTGKNKFRLSCMPT